jgi:hypothetical protein
MNATDSFQIGVESQIKRIPIGDSELVNIEDIELSDADRHPLGHNLNIRESPIANIFSRDYPKSNVDIRNEDLNLNYPRQPFGTQDSDRICKMCRMEMLGDPRLTGVAEE